jgi:RNase adaptor protein for sRNA GlmZ degradation
MLHISNESEIRSPMAVTGDNAYGDQCQNSAPLPILRITSWGHRRGPLLPAPHISIDLRKLANPPRQVRGKHNGTSKMLKEWLFSNEEVRQRFDDVCSDIRMKLSEAAAVGCSVVTVGVNCELGRHRSVAFVEEMGRIKWDGWDVAIEHRDVNASHSQRIKRKGGLDRLADVDD